MTSMPAHSDDGRDHASRASSGEARLIAVVVLVALMWPTSAPAAEKIKVTIPAAAVTFASLYHAKAAGYFADEGVDVGSFSYQVMLYYLQKAGIDPRRTCSSSVSAAAPRWCWLSSSARSTPSRPARPFPMPRWRAASA